MDGEKLFEIINFITITSLNLFLCNNAREYDLIFMDIEMPFLDGFQTSDRINKILEERINCPKTVIIACSAHEEASENKLAKCKMKYYITKPIKKKDLELVLTKWANDY